MKPAHLRVAEPEADREVVLERWFNAPARLLFRAHSAPEQLMRWFGPPGYPLTLCEVDFREGGRYRFAMTGPDGQQGPIFGGEYLVVDPPRALSYTNRFEEPGAETMIVTVRFDEGDDGRTLLTMRTLFASVAMKELHCGWGYSTGVGAALDQLADLIAAGGLA